MGLIKPAPVAGKQESILASSGNENRLPGCYTLFFPGGLGNQNQAASEQTWIKYKPHALPYVYKK